MAIEIPEMNRDPNLPLLETHVNPVGVRGVFNNYLLSRLFEKDLLELILGSCYVDGYLEVNRGRF